MPGDRFIELALAEDRHVLDVLFRDAREAVTVQDRSGRLVYANDKAAALVGMSSGAEMVAAPLSDLMARFEMLDESGQPLSVESLPGRRVLAGLDAPEITIGYRSAGSTRVRWSRVNASPIKNDAGEVVWALNFFLDITEQMREREAERVLTSVAEVLGGSLTIRETLTHLADVLVGELADWCEVHLVDEHGDLVSAAVVVSDSNEARRLNATVDQERIRLGSDRIQARVVKTGQPELLTGINRELLLREGQPSPDPGLVEQLQIDSVTCVPLGTPNAPMGALTLARGRPGSGFDRADLALIERIGERAGVALANARIYELEHETAEALRAGLAPSSIPAIKGLSMAVRYAPMARLGHVGGDFYDVVSLSDDATAVLVGDIEGKGVPAAAAVGLARDTLRATLNLEPDPRVLLSQLNDALGGLPRPRMCTLAYVRLDRDDQRFTARITLAGHPAPLLLSPDGTTRLLGRPCPPAGLGLPLDPEETIETLRSGDTLFLYTDGYALPDRTPMSTVGQFVTGGEVEPLEPLLDRLLSDLKSEVEAPRDDILLLAIRID